MSYIQIEIEGVMRGLKFNNFAIMAASKKVSVEFADESAGYALLYGGLLGNCFVKGIEPDFTWEKSCEWYDIISQADKNLIVSTFNDVNNYAKDIEPDNIKKKVKKNTGMKQIGTAT